MYIHIIDKLSYSSVPNKCVWWNKHIGGKIPENLVNVMDGITVMVGIFGNPINKLNWKSKVDMGQTNHFSKKATFPVEKLWN